MKAAVLHAYGELPRFGEFADPVPANGEQLIRVTAAPLNNIDKVMADGTHYSVQGEQPPPLPAVPGVVAAGELPGGGRVLFGSRSGTMAQYAVASPRMTFPIPDGLDDALAAAAWNPGLSAWLLFGWRARPEPGGTVLVLGATGVTGQLAVQAARRHGAGRVVAAGRNPVVLGKLAERGADAVISLDQADGALAAAFAGAAGDQGFDIVADYLWGRPTEILLGALDRHDAEVRSARTRLVQAGEMAGSQISLPASVLRSAGLEILGMGTGTMPPPEQITAMLSELLDGLGSGEITMDCERVPLADVADLWARDQQGRRPVFIP
ncbi:MAG TPA: zinc-binding alcohol dehydrogenase family protein [Streptosporangiaceae bacterium]|nr:zinc-binding alcohol dehydrogenase family protein [Streptosporangiaceae bacterium]